MKRKVGVVILNYNGSDYLAYTLDSLRRAKNDCGFAVGVIDNGSAPEDADAAERLTEELFASGVEGFFIRSEENLGFSGGNNAVIRRFMEDKEITHVCMLNSDVVVTDHWLDYLTEDGFDAVGPVTNATGNEQTVAVDYEAELNDEAFDLANSFAEYRHRVFGSEKYETDILYFFLTVLSRRVVETVGYLDERFFPGSYEDGDYCLRMKEAGIRQMVVRGCYVHHFGSGSFSKLDMPTRVDISNVNRRRFEEKWGIAWENDTWKLMLSCRQDLRHFDGRPLDPRTAALLEKVMCSTETLLKNWAAGIEWFQSDGYIDQQIALRGGQALSVVESATPAPAVTVPVPAADYTTVSALYGKRLLWLIGQKLRLRLLRSTSPEKYEQLRNVPVRLPEFERPLVPLVNTSARDALALIRIKLREKLGGSVKASYDRARRLLRPVALQEYLAQQVTDAIRAADRAVLIHGIMFTPENERDGYIQRIRRIDESVFPDAVHVYVWDYGTGAEILNVEYFDEKHFFVTYNSHDPLQRGYIFLWAQLCGLQYVHSINPFMTDRVNVEMCQLLVRSGVRTVWDVHGSVPEEFEMYGNELGRDIANEVEGFFFRHADRIVVVNHATEKHLREKYGETQAEFVVLPILNTGLSDTSALALTDRGDSVIYCGGVQKWQNIALMQSIMQETADRIRYHVLVPDPKAFLESWEGNIPESVIVESKAPEEVGAVYDRYQYGFLLRDESVVNRVACPTKLLEYILHGIIPILKTPEIGDFADYGMKYVPYTDLLAGKLPTEEERQSMVRYNLTVFDRMGEAYESGLTALKSFTDNSMAEGIGIVVTTFDKGGLEQVVLNLYKGYKRAGYRVYMMVQENVLGEMAARVDFDELFVFNSDLDTFRDFIYRNRIGLLHYHYNIFGLDAAREMGVRCIYTMHNVYTWKSDSEIREYAAELAKMDRVIPVSQLVKQYYLDRTGVAGDNLTVIDNGIDFDELRLEELPERLTRKELGLEENDVVMAFVASFYPVKYQIGMIGVMEELIKKYPQVKLLFVGNSELEYFDEFERLRKKSPARDHMIVVPYFEHRYMGAFLRGTVDIFTLPTLQEGCSNAVLEAIFCDRPMVLTNVGNAADVAFLKSCRIVRPAYDDVVTTSNADMLAISQQSRSANCAELVGAFSELIEDLPAFKAAAVLPDREKEPYETEYMVRQYLEIIRKVTGFPER